MCHTEEPGSSPRESSNKGGKIISLCAHRRRRDIQKATEELVGHLTSIHHRAIEVHNEIIEQAEVSVLTELCRSTGLILDLIEEPLRSAIIIPAALYGDSGGNIFGKKPLQHRIAESIDDEDRRSVLRELNRGHPAVFDYEPGPDGPLSPARPLAGADCQQPREIAGIICRAGCLTTTPGLYSGWKITFRDQAFIVFGHRLCRRREVAVRDLFTACPDRCDPDIWSRIERRLLAVIVDPEHHHRPVADQGAQREGIRRPATRPGLLLDIRRTLWRQFCEPKEGVTMHAHLAALIDDPDSFEALLDEIRQVIDTATLKSGGLPEGAAPVEVGEILSSFHIDEDGRFGDRHRLVDHPATLLLLNEETMPAFMGDADATIGDALGWAAGCRDTSQARQIELAWMTYRSEQNLMATYGLASTDADVDTDTDDGLGFVRRSTVLPNMRTLFDPRFMESVLSDLELDGPAASRLRRGLEKQGTSPDTFSLAELDRDERDLTELPGVGHTTCNAVRKALLELGTLWRWRRCGIEPSSHLEPTADTNIEEGLADS